MGGADLHQAGRLPCGRRRQAGGQGRRRRDRAGRDGGRYGRLAGRAVRPDRHADHAGAGRGRGGTSRRPDGGLGRRAVACGLGLARHDASGPWRRRDGRGHRRLEPGGCRSDGRPGRFHPSWPGERSGLHLAPGRLTGDDAILATGGTRPVVRPNENWRPWRAHVHPRVRYAHSGVGRAAIRPAASDHRLGPARVRPAHGRPGSRRIASRRSRGHRVL
mgnify:CR=1 FL=1